MPAIFSLSHPDKVAKFSSAQLAEDNIPAPDGTSVYSVLRSSRPPCYIVAKYIDEKLIGYLEAEDGQ